MYLNRGDVIERVIVSGNKGAPFCTAGKLDHVWVDFHHWGVEGLAINDNHSIFLVDGSRGDLFWNFRVCEQNSATYSGQFNSMSVWVSFGLSLDESHPVGWSRVFLLVGGGIAVIGTLDADRSFTVVHCGGIRVGSLESGQIVVHVVYHLWLSTVASEWVAVFEVALMARHKSGACWSHFRCEGKLLAVEDKHVSRFM